MSQVHCDVTDMDILVMEEYNDVDALEFLNEGGAPADVCYSPVVTCDVTMHGGNTEIVDESCNLGLDSDDEATLDADFRSQGVEGIEDLVLSFLGQLESSMGIMRAARGSNYTTADGHPELHQKPSQVSRRTPRIQLSLADRRKISEDGAPGTRTICYPKNSQSSSAKPFAQLFKVMDCVHEALVNDAPTTKRDLYYKDVPLFKNQGVVDRIIDDLAATFQVERSHLNVRATSKGLISGSSLEIHLQSGESIEVADTEGTSIPVGEDILSFGLVRAINWVLVVEKDAIFQSLCKLRITDHPTMPGRGLLITGKGYPDIATRELVKTLCDNLPENIPILGLVDGDPYGLDILSTFKYGSRSLKHENSKLAAARIEWLGLCNDDLGSMGSDIDLLIPITRNDEKKALSMLSRPYPILPLGWRRELMRILHTRRKAEIEVISSARPSRAPILRSNDEAFTEQSSLNYSTTAQPDEWNGKLTASTGYLYADNSPSGVPSGSPMLRYLAGKIPTFLDNALPL